MPKRTPRDTFLIPFPVRPAWMADTFANRQQLKNVSDTSVLVPGYLLNYYNRRATISVSAELRNVEIQLALVDEAGNPLEQIPIVCLGNPDTLGGILRDISPSAEISGYLRFAQHLALVCRGRMINDDPFLADPTKTVTQLRHVTLILLMGELPP